MFAYPNSMVYEANAQLFEQKVTHNARFPFFTHELTNVGSRFTQRSNPRSVRIVFGEIIMDEDWRESTIKKEALDYHEAAPKGKIKVVPTKPHSTAHELSLAYSPGVAYPCLEIAEKPDDAYRYTSKGNLVAVISN